MQLILASQSPRRKELLEKLGLTFTIRVADIDETMDPTADPAGEVRRVAQKKAAAIAQTAPTDAVIVAADTIVVVDGQILGKPKDEADARRMLTLLSGSRHSVLTGLAVQDKNGVQAQTVRTTVRFRPLCKSEIEAYIRSGEPMDKAGSYGVQALGAVFVEGLDGDYYNVMGLPLCALCQMLRAAGVPILDTTNEEPRTRA